MSLSVILIIVAGLFFNALFSAYELALASVRTERLRLLADQHRTGARSALWMKGRMELSLAVAQLGITVAMFVSAAAGGADAEKNLTNLVHDLGIRGWFAHVLAIGCVVIPLSALNIVLGELVPKVFGVKYSEWVCRMLSPTMFIFTMAVFPAVWVFEGVTKMAIGLLDRLLPDSVTSVQQTGLHELRAQVNLLRASKVIGVQEEQIILQASRLSGTKVREIMLPEDDIVMVRSDAPLTENLVVAHLDLHTRFPVTERKGDPQAIIGYVTFKEMIMLAKTHPGNPVLREITRPLISLRDDLSVSDALRQMIAEHVHLALVRDANGKIVGLITQEDIFEELVGDIQDEFDRLPRYIAPSGHQWVVGGGASLAQLRAALHRPELGGDLPSSTTVHDWLQRSHTDDFKGGDTMTIEGMRVLVRKIRRRRVTEALLDPEVRAEQPSVV